MNDHTEFPWGPQYEPGLLTPLGVIGWAVAAVLLLGFVVSQLGLLRFGRRDGKAIQDAYSLILAVARYASRQDEFGILGGANLLRRTITLMLGGLLQAGGGLGKQAKKLAEVMGESDDKKGDAKGHGPAASGGAHSVASPSITLNFGVGADRADNGHGGHGDHGHSEDDEKHLPLDQQLAAIRKAVREFEVWWSDKSARTAELKAALGDLTIPKKADRTLIAQFGDPNKPAVPDPRLDGLFGGKKPEEKKSLIDLIEEKK